MGASASADNCTGASVYIHIEVVKSLKDSRRVDRIIYIYVYIRLVMCEI